MKKSIILFITFLLCFVSCVEQIYKLDTNYEQTPIVNCLFTNDSIFTVYVGLTTDMFSQNTDSITIVSVKILSDNGDTLYFTKNDTHIYVSDSVAKQGVNYKLVVETSNYGTLTAESKIPIQTAKIDTANFYENIHYNPLFNNLFDKITLSIYDETVNVQNYFEAVVLSKTEAVTIDDIPFCKLFFSTNYYTDCSIITNQTNPNKTLNSLLFKTLNAQNSNQEIYFYCNVYYVPEETKYLVLNLKQTSIEYYLYRKSLVLNNIPIDNNFTTNYIINNNYTEENNEIYSNINNGLGIFAGYNCSENYIIQTN